MNEDAQSNQKGIGQQVIRVFRIFCQQKYLLTLKYILLDQPILVTPL